MSSAVLETELKLQGCKTLWNRQKDFQGSDCVSQPYGSESWVKRKKDVSQTEEECQVIRVKFKISQRVHQNREKI